MKINLQPTLVGENVTLRPLSVDDFEGLYDAASDPAIWETHPDKLRYQRDIFKERFFDGAISSGSALAIVCNKSKKIIGSSRYYDEEPKNKEIAVGYTFIERAFWGNGINKELKELMLNYIFKFVDHVWFHVGEDNLRSRKAVESIGAVFSHSEEQYIEGSPFIQLFYKLSESAKLPNTYEPNTYEPNSGQ
ncbi:GNAT family N-acetyltransferase [Litoribacillus peritrichatus]|uniref:GNAT family protein n=1 Tax=Litoribacillus peritrichatus TaxID=718191 RepID=A0ABP7MGT5_9GAMM